MPGNEEFHSRGANQIDKRAESGKASVSLTTGSGSVTVTFDEPFEAAPHYAEATLGGGIDGDPSVNNVTQDSMDVVVANSGAADGSYPVYWRAVAED